ncbi:MAG TPA: transcriptional regulator, partial [Nordella sp.]|nr:transcriptional regulator [Nordella sp.]
SVTATGARACQRYHEIREALLVRSVGTIGIDQQSLSRIAAQMRALSGHYDQAARAAASL